MSGGISNLGMGYNPQRMASQVITSPDEIAAQQRAQAQALAAPQTPQAYLASLINTRANDLATYYNTPDATSGYTPDGTLTADVLRQQLTTNAGNWLQGQGSGSYGFQNLLGPNLAQLYTDYAGTTSGMSAGVPYTGTTPGTYDTQYAAYQQQSAADAAAANAANQQQQQNLQLQQQAYGQQTGGGFTGGLLNPSYSQPFNGTLGFNGGMMGSGQAPAASTGLNAWLPQNMGPSPSAGNSGAWGGPFSNKNPWSLG